MTQPLGLSMLGVLATMFGQGLLHGVGPDHCLAIGSLASRGGLRRALAVSLRFGVAHTAVLAVCAMVAALAGVAIPARWERALEIVGGLSLLALGVWTVLDARAVATHDHGDGRAHVHLFDDGHAASEPRAVRDEARVAGSLSAVAGAVFGLSGVRALVVLLPVTVQRAPLVIALSVLLFGAGVVVSMLGVGWLAQGVGARARRIERALRLVVGVASMAVGAWWVVSRL